MLFSRTWNRWPSWKGISIKKGIPYLRMWTDQQTRLQTCERAVGRRLRAHFTVMAVSPGRHYIFSHNLRYFCWYRATRHLDEPKASLLRNPCRSHGIERQLDSKREVGRSRNPIRTSPSSITKSSRIFKKSIKIGRTFILLAGKPVDTWVNNSWYVPSTQAALRKSEMTWPE